MRAARQHTSFTIARLMLGTALAVASFMAVSASRNALASRALLQQDGDNQCVSIGLGLQTACENELKEGTKFFGISGGDSVTALQSAGSISPDAVNKYLSQASAPSASCCKASCQFNSQLCSCDPGITALISSYTGNNLGAYYAVAQAISKACGFTAYVDTTCPANAATQTKPYGKAC